ncbi:stage III sporulation protein AF [Metabacillus crassostreae]|uniref:stage III sporulation protein AF n=1 Tax=Metabacillus crassostreae TaxID=929098 RepID=UPI001958F7D7|nr:stage III sporulation protein AF [Metabacillus crassostreae]MBM7604596.1 stage III sporulation protein AF [Metabacillus crassostreae]
MSFLTEWITNIIVFILLAVVIDLLLPNSSMQKYAKMVISLLLIIVIINPIFKLFSKDMNDVLSEFTITSASENENTKNLIEFQKKEIQASQRAYILKQMAVQMKTMADEELVDKYDVMIDKILLSESNQVANIQSHKDLQEIQVVLKKNQQDQVVENGDVDTVKPVSIDTSRVIPKDDAGDEVDAEKIAAALAEIWEVEVEVIKLQVERGEESLDEQ